MAPNQNLGDRDQPCENSGVRLRVVARDARSASVAGHVVRSSIIVQPGDRGSASATVAHTHNSNVSSNTWCTRKNLCVPRNWEFRHATRILDVIMLKYPLKMRPMPGMWVQSVPVTAIPWGGMNTEQCNTLQRSVRQDD